MDTQTKQESRYEKRFTIESFTLPFLATRESDYQTFQYVLRDSSQTGAGIAIPNWTLAREHLIRDERINLHVPFHIHKHNFYSGKVAWSKFVEEEGSQYCGIHLDKQTPIYYPIYLDLALGEVSFDLQDFSGSDELLFKIFKDSIFLKKGIKIYLNHLLPYFSRITSITYEDFDKFRKYFLESMKNNLSNNLQGLENIYIELKENTNKDSELASSLDLEKIRQFIQSEIYIDIFKIALQNDLAQQYIMAIKTLEGRLYYNYNTMVMLFMKSFIFE